MEKNRLKRKNSNFKNGLMDGLPIGLGYLPVAFAFGVQASIVGIPLFMSVFISMTNLTSAGQLAGLTIIASAGTILEIILTQLVINARYFLMSITLSQKLDDSFTLSHRFLCSAFVTDEIFAVASSKPKTFNRKYFYGLVVLPYVGWSLGTLLGAAAGNVLPETVTNALGIALYAMFIAIITRPAIKDVGILFAVLLGAIISSVLYFIPIFDFIPSGMKIILSAIIASALTALVRPIKNEEEVS